MRAARGSVWVCSSRWIASSSLSSSSRSRCDLGRGAAGGLEVEDRRAAARVEGHALMLGGQEPAGPVEGPAGGVRDAAGVGQDDEAGEVLVLGPQAVRQPGAHRREAHLAEPGVRLEDAGDVVGGLRDHRVDHRQLVGDLGQVREQVGDPQAALAAALEGVVRLVEPPHLAEERVGLAEALGHVLAVVLLQLGLVVERVDLAQAAAEEDVDDVPGLRLEVRAGTARRVGCRRLQVAAAQQQVGRRDRGQAEDGVPQEVPARRLDRSSRSRDSSGAPRVAG